MENGKVIRLNKDDDYMSDLPNVLERLKKDYDENNIKEVAIVWERGRSSRDDDEVTEVMKDEYFVERYWCTTSIDRLLGLVEELKMRAYLKEEGIIK